MAELRRKPTDERKIDALKNSEFAEVRLREVIQRDREAGKIPLRIDSKTVILVCPKNCNETYAARMRAKFNKIK